MHYPKINTLWERDEQNKFRITEGAYSLPEFKNIKAWEVSEKIDGCNTRIIYKDGVVKFGGRTDNAQIPTRLLDYLQTTFTKDLLDLVFDCNTHESIVLFGEGYGAKIQKGGGLYRPDNAFILFDVWASGWWLRRENVKDIAGRFNIKCVPSLGIMTIDEIVNYVKSEPQSAVTDQAKIAEGIVARSHPLMLFRDGNPVMFKLKVKDYAI